MLINSQRLHRDPGNEGVTGKLSGSNQQIEAAERADEVVVTLHLKKVPQRIHEKQKNAARPW